MCCCYNTVSSWQVGYFCSVWSRLVRLTTIRAYDSFVFVHSSNFQASLCLFSTTSCINGSVNSTDEKQAVFIGLCKFHVLASANESLTLLSSYVAQSIQIACKHWLSEPKNMLLLVKWTCIYWDLTCNHQIHLNVWLTWILNSRLQIRWQEGS